MPKAKSIQDITWKANETIDIWDLRGGQLAKMQIVATIAVGTGLAYHLHSGREFRDGRARWGINHLKSGMDIGVYFFEEFAVRKGIECIAGLTDWRKRDDVIRRIPGFRVRMEEAMKSTGLEVDFEGLRAIEE